jgi:putative endonuclease
VRDILARQQNRPGLKFMKFVYILESLTGEHFYTGITDDLDARLAKHNSGAVTHTAKYRPWKIKTYLAFSSAGRAFDFEKYLKSGSGRAFANKRL